VSAPSTRPDRSASEGVFRLSVAHFLFALLVLFATVPFLDDVNGELIESILMTLVLLSAVVAVGGSRRSLITAIVLVAPAVITKWAAHVWPQYVTREYTQAAAILFLSFIVVQLFYFILTAPEVNSEVLSAAIAVYLLLGLTWAFAYGLVAGLNPKAFAFTVPADSNSTMVGFQTLYFSFITLTTVGYGDIVPLSRPARFLAMAEATAGMFFATILIARLVAIHSSNRKDRPA
jgi:Ion channel